MNDGFDYRETIGSGSAGATVLEHLVRSYRHSSEEEWQDRLRAGRVLLDGSPTRSSARLRRGQVLVWRRPPWIEPEAPAAWALLHRDRDVLGVAKPPGLPTLPGGGYLQASLLFLVRRLFPEAAPVHRLDRGASGVVLFARHAAAGASLREAFRRGEIEKEYVALVEGEPECDRLEVDRPIGVVPHPRWGAIHAAVFPHEPRARPARSVLRVLRRCGGRSLVEVRPLTGRPHQIRIHLAAVGHPLVGDPLYGAGGRPKTDGSRPGDGGYLLHARGLDLRHPVTGERLSLRCRPPAALRAEGE